MLQVTCALIEHDNKVLICQRSAIMKLPLKWEFPGGKIEAGESKAACLRREIYEELAIEISVEQPLAMVEHQYPEFSLSLYPFICTWKSGNVQLAEHIQALWVDPSDLMNYDWAEADVPIVKAYLKIINRS